MPDHRIRIRGPWDRSTIGGDGAGPPGRVSLPCPGPGELSGRFRLIRRFGRPPHDPARESLRLDLADVPGLLRVTLNGVDRPLAPAGGPPWSIPIDEPLPDRNVLALDVDFAGVEGFAAPWGSISLAIGPKGEEADPGDLGRPLV